MAVRRAFVEDLYRNTLGRGDDFTPGEVEGWLGAESEDAVRAAFLGSPEYTSKHGGTATWQNDAQGYIVPVTPSAPPPDTGGFDVIGGGGGDVSHGYSAATAPPSSQPYTGFTPQYDFSAFNIGRQQDPGKSAKDAYAMLANQAPAAPFQSKAALSQWFTQHIAPGMNALGHEILSANEDGFTFRNHEGTFFVDFAQNAGAAPGSMLQRHQWNATPADDATRQRYAASGAGASGGGASGGGSLGDLSSLLGRLGQLGAQFGGPGGPGITNGPLQQVGQDPFSETMVGALIDFLDRGGTTPFGQQARERILQAVDHGGDLDEAQMARRFESARELVEKARRSQIDAARGELANRNLLSEPGIPQGAEIGAVRRISESLGEDFARTMRDIVGDEAERASAREVTALGLMVGMSGDEAKQFLAAIGEGSARQQMLGDLALRTLQTNMAWNQFLAEFGLQRDQVLQMLQSGRVNDVMGLLNNFLTLASLSRGGYV